MTLLSINTIKGMHYSKETDTLIVRKVTPNGAHIVHVNKLNGKASGQMFRCKTEKQADTIHSMLLLGVNIDEIRYEKADPDT